jgi:hypothetical protein
LEVRDKIKQETLAAIEELERDILGGQHRPRVLAALALIFAREKKDEFRSWLESKKATMPKDDLAFGIL